MLNRLSKLSMSFLMSEEEDPKKYTLLKSQILRSQILRDALEMPSPFHLLPADQLRALRFVWSSGLLSLLLSLEEGLKSVTPLTVRTV